MEEQKKQASIGAIWMKQGQKGEFMSGKITTPLGETVRFVGFTNTYKEEGDNKPSWNLLPSTPAGGEQ